jgi:hypothetical protein
MLLMLKRLEVAFNNKRTISNNRDFLKMHKILLKEGVTDCPIMKIDRLQRLAIFDEIDFSNDLDRIKFI